MFALGFSPIQKVVVTMDERQGYCRVDSDGGGSARGVELEAHESSSKENCSELAFLVLKESTALAVAACVPVRLAAEYMATPIQRINDLLFRCRRRLCV